MLRLPEQKHLLGRPGQSCLQLPGTQQTAGSFQSPRASDREVAVGVTMEGCGFAGCRGVVTEDLGTGPVWWPLEWMLYVIWVVEERCVWHLCGKAIDGAFAGRDGKVQKDPVLSCC